MKREELKAEILHINDKLSDDEIQKVLNVVQEYRACVKDDKIADHFQKVLIENYNLLKRLAD